MQPFVYIGMEGGVVPASFTNWVFQQVLSEATSGGTDPVVSTPTVLANQGDLMVCFWGAHCATTHFTSASISDSSVGGATWAPLADFVATNKISQMGWWKRANAADYNGGDGITVTATGGDGVGAVTQACIECDVYRTPPSNLVLGIDVSQSGAFVNVNTAAIAAPPSSYPRFMDALAVTSLYGISAGTATGTNTYTGASVTNLTPDLGPPTSSPPTGLVIRPDAFRGGQVLRGGASVAPPTTFLIDQYGSPVQSSATGTPIGFAMRSNSFRSGESFRGGLPSDANTWTNTWTNTVNVCMMGATFVYLVPTSTLLTLGVG